MRNATPPEGIWTDIIVQKLPLVKIAAKYSRSISHVSNLASAVKTLKYKPRIAGEQVVCLACGNPEKIVVHKVNGLAIGLLCKQCHTTSNQTAFDAEETDIATTGGVIVALPAGFPLNGRDLVEVLENIHVFEVAVNEPVKYSNWADMNPDLEGKINSLIQWSKEAKHIVA